MAAKIECPGDIQATLSVRHDLTIASGYREPGICDQPVANNKRMNADLLPDDDHLPEMLR
jgi:hypothetical protein